MNTLEEKGEVATTLKTIFVMIGLVVIFVTVVLEVSFSNVPIVVESALAYSVITGVPASLLTRTILMVYWERQKKNKNFSR